MGQDFDEKSIASDCDHCRSNHLHRNYDNGAPGLLQSPPLSIADVHDGLVNDVCIHPNQGELISCDQAGSIKQWDLSENVCTLDLVGKYLSGNAQLAIDSELGTGRRCTHSIRQHCF